MATNEFELFDLSTIAAKPKGFDQKFFAEALPKYNALVEMRTAYLQITGGTEKAIESLLDGDVPDEVGEMLNAIAEAETLIEELTAKAREWAESQLAESGESPELIREKFDATKAVLSKRIAGSTEYFEMQDYIGNDDEDNVVGLTPEGEAFVKLLSLPAIRKGKSGGRIVSGWGKRVRTWGKENDVRGPEGEEIGKQGVLPTWLKDAYLKANPTDVEPPK